MLPNNRVPGRRSEIFLLPSSQFTAVGAPSAVATPRARSAGVAWKDACRGLGDQLGSCCDPVLLLFATHHDIERVVGQRALQRLGLVPRRAHPDVSLFIGG